MKNLNPKPTKNFTKVPNWLLGEARLRQSEFRLLLYLWQHAARFNPSYADITDATGMDPQTISTCLKSLQALGILEIQRTTYATSMYTITEHKSWQFPGRENRVQKGDKARRRSTARARQRMREEVREEVLKELTAASARAWEAAAEKERSEGQLAAQRYEEASNGK